MWRVAIYAREAPGRVGRVRLERQVTGLCVQIARWPDWSHVATYADQAGLGGVLPGLSRLVAEAPGRVDVVVVDGYGRLSLNRREQTALLARLGGAGVRVVVLAPSTGRRLTRMVANLALADMIGEAAR